MSVREILEHRDLLRLAAEIRTRHDEASDLEITLDAPDETPGFEASGMDARERKWAAQKLLRPICQDEEKGLTPEELVDLYCEVWRLRTGMSSPGPEDWMVDLIFMHEQLEHTALFVQRTWGLAKV